MKNRIAMLALSALLVAGGADAQTAMGVRAGMNRTSLTGTQDSEAITGLAVGAYLGTGLGDRVALQLELAYGERGGAGVMVGEDRLDMETGTPSEIRLRYIEIPLLLRAGYAGERFLPSLFIGPYAMFLTSCDLAPDGGASGSCDDESREAWFTPRSTDWGLVTGASLDYALGESTVFIDVRYSLGFLDIQRGAGAMDLSNSGLTISGGFAVPLSR